MRYEDFKARNDSLKQQYKTKGVGTKEFYTTSNVKGDTCDIVMHTPQQKTVPNVQISTVIQQMLTRKVCYSNPSALANWDFSKLDAKEVKYQIITKNNDEVHIGYGNECYGIYCLMEEWLDAVDSKGLEFDVDKLSKDLVRKFVKEHKNLPLPNKAYQEMAQVIMKLFMSYDYDEVYCLVNEIDEDDYNRIKLLADYLEVEANKITKDGSEHQYCYEDERYLVLNEEESRELFEERLDNLLEECPSLVEDATFSYTYHLDEVREFIENDIRSYIENLDEDERVSEYNSYLTKEDIEDNDADELMDLYVEARMDGLSDDEDLVSYMDMNFGEEWRQWSTWGESVIEPDYDSIKEEYGYGHELANYDGVTIELNDDYYAYRIE